MMKLGCIILNYNDSSSVIELHNLIKGYSSIDNIIIVDNCSTDDSYAVLKRLEDRHTYVISSERNGGYGYGNNVGIKYARESMGATHALIANPDVIFDNETVEALRETFEAAETNDIAVVAPIVWENGVARDWRLPSARDLVLERSKIYKRLCKPKRFYEASYFQSKNPCSVDVVLGAMLMVDIDKMQKMNLYDDEVFLFEEETMLGVQCKKFGYSTLVLPQHEYMHKKSISVNKSIKSRINRERIVNKSKLVVLQKYYKVGSLGMRFAKCFYAWCLMEIRAYEWFRRYKEK